MEKISFEQFKNKIKQGEKDFTNLILENMNLENYDLSDMNFSHSNFINANLSNVNFYSSQLVNVLLDDCNLQNANLKNANLERASLRRVNLTYADIRGAKLYAAVLENAILDNIIFDDKTENFRIHCPEQGAFVAYKKGLDNLIIKLLIPSDARRVSSTMNCCRCDKAKVLEIKNFEGTKFFDEAWSTVAENFCYKLGEWVNAGNFNEDRWYDSTGGIHFWMTEDEAKAY
ncbi:pentapeptide repeat-containing protein [Gemella morbillorum]|uniref:pentapeptide repeat-containing protein n=1 Tax=Gemella morbillorum TaxID=29391 RepID=UPI002551BB0A|nr:pentapeptide repeat-containing protein [Gemella morbillorum]MDK8254533.1 pentapeptide repeat-containing protein [Gemella morbillorum]